MSISKIIIIDMVDILIKLNIEKTLYDLSEVNNKLKSLIKISLGIQEKQGQIRADRRRLKKTYSYVWEKRYTEVLFKSRIKILNFIL